MLVVEDSPDDAELILRALRSGGFAPQAERVETLEALLAALDAGPWDIVISDYYLPSLEAPEVLAVVRERTPDTPFLVVSGSVGEEHAVAAMKAGAHDYVMKDRLARLAPAVEREMREAAARRERHLLEEQLRQAQKMDAIGRLAGGVAHDMNNLLTAVLGSSELLLLDLAPGPVREEITEIRAVAERAAALVRHLLAFSRLQVLEPRVLDLNALVADCGKMLRRLIGEHIELRTGPGAGLGSVRADPGQIEQVIVNLVVNARDAMPEGGRLTIETANADLDAEYAHRHVGVTPGRYVMLAVSDTGVGMDKTVQARLFEPFFTTKPQGKGTGLGLSTVYGIIKQSGGNVFVYSEPGKGATFKIYLPRVDAQAAAASAGRPAAAPGGGTETVLVVEDEPVVRTLARKVLTHQGYTVLEAASGAEALEVIRGNSPTPPPLHLLLTDVVMPEMSGRELMRRIAQLRPGVKVLYMSGYSDDAVVRHGVLDPGTAFIQKPFTPDGLARKVREVLDG